MATVTADRGRQATTPTSIPRRGWRDIAARTAAEAKRDQLVLLGAGVAFFALLALIPGIFAMVSLYGLVADPSDVSRHVTDLLGAAPPDVRNFVEEQLDNVASGSTSLASIGAILGLLVALWSASSGMKHLIDALNATYDETEGRGFVKVRGLALMLTVGAVVFVTVGVITVVPALVPGPLALIRWPILGAAFVAGLAVLYRYAPSRDNAEWRWTTPGALFAAVLWLIGSGLFSVYVANFGSYNETYGTLGGVVAFLVWLWITNIAILFGAELNAETERAQQLHTGVPGAEDALKVPERQRA
jgi:membrane protein